MRFAVISDTHFYAPGRGEYSQWWNRGLEPRSVEIQDSLVSALSKAAVDFVIHCGDFAGTCDMPNFERGVATMDQVGCDWYAVVGNHDTWYPPERSAFSARYGLPDQQCYYVREIGGVVFVFLDTAYWRHRDGTTSTYLDRELFDAGLIEGCCIPEDELVWLETTLQHHADRPAVLVSHAPLGFKPYYRVGTLPGGKPAPDAPVPPTAFMADVAGRERLREIIARCGNVKLAFAGHWHLNEITREAGVIFCQTGALREYPFEFRVVTVAGGELTMTMRSLENRALVDASLVSPWGNEWVAGNDADRTLHEAFPV